MGNKVALLAISVLVIAFALIGCGGGGGGGTENPVGPASLTGSVADLTGMVSLSGQPLADAAVYLYSSQKALQAGVSGLASLRGSVIAQTRLGDGSYFTKTDSTGRYSFTGVPVGEYTLIAIKDELHQYAQTGVMLGSVTTADALLTPTGKVIGRLQLPSGQPVSAAIVHLEKTSYVAISDVNGDFVINHVPAGQIFALGVVSTVGNLQNSVPVLIAPAEEKQLGNLTLAVPTQQVSNITGTIAAADSSVPAGAIAGRIVIVISSDPYPVVALSDSAGNYNVAVKSTGNYNVSIVGGEFAVSPTVQSVTVSALGTSVGVAQPFVLAKPAVILPPTTPYYAFSGTLNKRSKAFNEADEAGILVTLTALDSTATVYSAVTSPTGSFTFSVPAGSYNLAAGGGYAFETAFTNPVAVSANTSLPSILWVVPTVTPAQLFTVGGTALKTPFVNGDTNHAGVTVTLTSTAGAAHTYTASTDAVGSFSLSVPAGSYNLAVISSSYRPATALPGPVNVTGNMVLASLNLNPIQAPVNLNTISGSVNKVEFIAGESNNGGVIITLTRIGALPITYDTVSDASGYFAMRVAPGSYTLAVSSGYRFVAAFANPVDATAGNVNISPAIGIVPLAEKMFVVSGSVNKVLRKVGETSNGDVNVTLRSDSATMLPQVAITDALGRFSFRVPAGNYALEIGSGYGYVTPPSGFPYAVSTADVLISSPLDIRPLQALSARFSGTVSPVLANNPYTVRMEKTDGSYSDIETTSSNGSFSFTELSAGEYRVVVVPSGNGYYAEFGPFVLAEGQSASFNLSATQVAPVISMVSIVNLERLVLNGANFLSQPDVAADTQIFVDGNYKQRAAGFTLAADSDSVMVTAIPPGTHNVYIEKLWTRPGTTESWRLKSQSFPFMLGLAAPTNLKMTNVGVTGATVAWVNPGFSQKSQIEIWQAGANIATYTAGLGVSSFDIPGLQPLTTYEVRVRSVYGEVVSPAGVTLPPAFSTLSNANFGIESRLLAGSDLIANDTVFGFEVLNDITYVARYAISPVTGIFITAYNPDGSVFVSEYPINSSNISPNSLSFTSGGGKLFLEYTDFSTESVAIQCLNANLTLSHQAAVPAVATYSESQLVFANGKLFSAGANYGGSDYRMAIHMFADPTVDLTSSTIVSSYTIFSSQGAPSVRLCADNSDLYCARIGNMNAVLVEKYPLSITGPVVPTSILQFVAYTSPVFISQFDCGAGQLYLKVQDSYGVYDNYIDPVSGYFRDEYQEAGGGRGNYAVDAKGRIWMGEDKIGKNYIQTRADGFAEKGLGVYDFPNPGTYPDPAEFLKVDSVKRSFNMLYKDFDGASYTFKVFHYPETY